MSEIKVNSVVNSTGDNDSGLDLSTNDQVIIKTANTTAITVDASQNATFANKLNTSNLGTGAVLQTVVQQEDGATTFTQSGSSDVIMLASNAGDSTSHLSLSITPKFTSSKILLTACVFHEVNTVANESTLWSFYRDSTKLSAPIAGNRRSGIGQTAIGYFGADNDSTPDTVNYHYYDSPNTTSAITYAVSFHHITDDTILSLNKTVTDSNSAGYERGMSILIAQEIAG